jgi:hypothetical protein
MEKRMSNRELKTIFRKYPWNKVDALGEPNDKGRHQSRSANALANFERQLDPVLLHNPEVAVSIKRLLALMQEIERGNV